MRQPQSQRTALRVQPTHSQLRATVCGYLGLQGAWFLPILGGIGTRRGSPDVVGCLQGRFVACELKVGRDKLRPEQAAQRVWIERAGGIWVEVRRLEDLEAALEKAGLTMMGRLL